MFFEAWGLFSSLLWMRRRKKIFFAGGYRSVSQTVSYEVSMVFFFLVFVYFLFSYDLCSYSFFQAGYWFLFFRVLFCLG